MSLSSSKEALDRSASPPYCWISASAADLPVSLEIKSLLLACSNGSMAPPVAEELTIPAALKERLTTNVVDPYFNELPPGGHII